MPDEVPRGRAVAGLTEPPDGPDEAAYGRVTDPERYRSLHGVARSLVRDLVERFDVVVEEGDGSLDPELAAKFPGGVEALVRLTPSDGAPVVVSLTRFPGVHLRAGRGLIEGFPHCGCDACDEDPGDVADELRWTVDAIVSGRFTEGLRAVALWDTAGRRRANGYAEDGRRAAPWPRRPGAS